MFEITVEIPEKINPANGGSYSLSRLVTVQIGAAQMAKLAQHLAVQLRLHLTAFGVQSSASNSLQMSLFADVPPAIIGGG